MDGGRRISGKPEVARRRDFRRNAAILTGSHQISCFRWSTLTEAENNQTASKGIGKHRMETESNGSWA